MMRRALSVIGIIVVIAIVVLAGWYFSKNRSIPTPEETPAATTPAKLPPVPSFGGGKAGGSGSTGGSGSAPSGGTNTSARFGVVAQNPIAAYYVSPQNAILLIQPDGVVAQVAGTNQTVLSEQKINNLVHASISANGQKILTTSGESSTLQVKVFDVTTKTWRTLPADIKGPVWSPEDERIVFLSSNSPEFSVIATLDLKNPKAQAVPVMQIHAQDLVLDWTGKNEVVVSEKSSSFVQSSAWRLDLTTKALIPLVTSQWGALLAWNSAARLGALFTTTRANRGGDLGIVREDGRVVSRSKIVTLPPKCTFLTELVMPSSTPSSTTTSTTSSKTKKAVALQPKEVHSLVCGFPQNLQDFNMEAQPDAYFQRKFYSEDSLYQIDLETGVVTNLYPENTYTFDATALRAVNDRLFFVNRYDTKLYALDLKQSL